MSESGRFDEIFSAYRNKTPGSGALFQRNLSLTPGGVSHGVRFQDPYPLFARRAEGSRIWDVDGNRYIDLWMGHYALILGHNHPRIKEALMDALDKGVHFGVPNEMEVELAELIRECVPCAETVRFCCSGTEANMYAIRLARAYTRKPFVLKLQGGWHGPSTELCWDVFPPYSGEEGMGLIPGMSSLIGSIFFNDIEKTRQIIRRESGRLAAVIVEPVMGAAGFFPATGDYLLMLREETRKSGAILIFDEVITGFRLGLGGAQQFYGIMPDMATLGKVAGGGMPIGVIVGPEEVLRLARPRDPSGKDDRVLIGGGTYSCNPLSMTAGLTALSILKSEAAELYPRLEQAGERLRKGLQAAFDRLGIPASVTGTHSLHMLHFTKDPERKVTSPAEALEHEEPERREEYQYRMRNKGVFMVHAAGALSAAHTEEDVARIIERAEETAGEMAGKKA